METVKSVQISASVEETLRDELAKLAKKGERTFSAEVRRALRLYVLSQKGAT